jgi:hypothetical protein
MADQPRRTPQQLKEAGVQSMKDSYEKMNRTTCPPEKIRQYEKLHEQRLIPGVFDKKK